MYFTLLPLVWNHIIAASGASKGLQTYFTLLPLVYNCVIAASSTSNSLQTYFKSLLFVCNYVIPASGDSIGNVTNGFPTVCQSINSCYRCFHLSRCKWFSDSLSKYYSTSGAFIGHAIIGFQIVCNHIITTSVVFLLHALLDVCFEFVTHHIYIFENSHPISSQSSVNLVDSLNLPLFKYTRVQ